MSATPQSRPGRTTLVPHPAGHPGTLRTADGEELPVQTYDGGEEVVLVVLTQLQAPLADEALDPSTLEYVSARGIIRLQGEAVFAEDSVVRFHAQGEPELVQRRAFVRVHAIREVLVDDAIPGGMLRTQTIDVSGGGMLLYGADRLNLGDEVAFEFRLGDDVRSVQGVARVVRTGADGRRALSFERIDEDDRQRLIRFVFQCMRTARAKTRGDLV